MGFETGTDYLSVYRTERGKALNNERRMSWFCDGAESLGALMDTFSSSAENAAWEKLYGDKTSPTRKLEAARIKIAFLASCRRDLRMLFAATHENRMRTPLDHDRFEYMRLAHYRLRIDILRQILQAKEHTG